MKKIYWIVLFVIVLLTDLAAIYLDNETLRNLTKPLLMPILIGYFIAQANSFTSSLKKWIVLALVFSWAGDVLLMFEPMNNNFFIFGLVAFLLAHVFYILFYENIIWLEHLKKNYSLFVPVILYYAALIYFLLSHLGDMKFPVIIYGLVISYMLAQALQIARIKNKKTAVLMIAGAVLFISSDSILAVNKFYNPLENAGMLIMLTYGVAQLLITIGAARYILSISKQ